MGFVYIVPVIVVCVVRLVWVIWIAAACAFLLLTGNLVVSV